MSKFFIVCPHCKAKYAVADRNIAGKAVTCKKCSQKFSAKIYTPAPAKAPAQAAAAPVAPDPFGSGDNDPFGSSGADDLFADMPASSSAGPALTSLPPTKRKASSSSGSLPIVPIAIAGGVVVVLAVVVLVGISIANSGGGGTPSGLPNLGSPLAGGMGNSGTADFEQHHKVLDMQMDLMNRFIVAIENVNGEQDIPQFVSTVNGLTEELKGVANHVKKLPRVSEENNRKLSKEAEQRMMEFLPRMKAAGLKMAQYNQNQSVTNAMLGFQAAGQEVSAAISSAK